MLVGWAAARQVDALLEYLHTDTIVFREENPEAWEDLQAEVWDPLVAWANGKYALDLQTTTAIFAPEVSEGDLATMRNVVDGFGDESVPAGTPDHKTWGLMGLEHLTATSKSMIVSLALLDGEVTVEEAARAARLEVVFQTSRFGEVEWHHTLEQYDTTVRLGAAALFTRECMYVGHSAQGTPAARPGATVRAAFTRTRPCSRRRWPATRSLGGGAPRSIGCACAGALTPGCSWFACSVARNAKK